ncbi:hypothetical protein L6164_008223 [Bauhinia variegata]|uniref:Uncharacterized protein n=1 Tax=Bauhinia variegata TaxID=167791 RepID=A0ACB9PGB8_BAUVA|nr:hypothetical protein L6164_008223 [Bauhinia variegata]
MKWRNYYMDVMLIPSGSLIAVTYHVWLWHKVQTQPFSTIYGIDVDGLQKRFWHSNYSKHDHGINSYGHHIHSSSSVVLQQP